MSNISKGWRPFRSVTSKHDEYLARIRKTLYYGKLPKTDSLSVPVTELAAELFSEAQKEHSLNRLHYNDAARISKNACVSPCSLVLALLYLERLKKSNPDYLLNTAPSDLFLVSLMISCKFLFDDGETDEVFVDEWAASSGLTIKDVVQLEKQFLKAIDWSVYVNEDTFWKKLNELERRVAKKQAGSRGFFTYTELLCLSSVIELQSILQNLLAVSLLLITTYTACIMTITTSMFITSQIPGTYLHKPLETIKANNSNVIILPESNLNPSSTFFELELESNASSWNWWSNPTMIWLSERSEMVKTNVLPVFDWKITDTTISDLPLNDFKEISSSKAIKTRIQDQIESSWHTEWIDTMLHDLLFVQNMK